MVFFNKGFPCNETVHMCKLQWDIFMRGKLLDYLSERWGFFVAPVKMVQCQLIPGICSYAACYTGLRKKQCIQEMLELEYLIHIIIRDRRRHEIQQTGQMVSSLCIHCLALEVLMYGWGILKAFCEIRDCIVKIGRRSSSAVWQVW